MTGLTSLIPMPHLAEAKKRWLRDIVGLILNAIEPNSSEHFVFTIQTRKNSHKIPLDEVKLDNSKLATKIRKLVRTLEGFVY
jgi:hypothetical protein